MIKFPYDIRKFTEIINGNYVYIDRTDKIRFMEAWGHELLFLRPRGFGKSLWLSMMMDYYDVAKADSFEQLFGHLMIGQEPTPLHNTYMVMRWDFSQICLDGSIEQIRKNLHRYLNEENTAFQAKYRELLPNAVFDYSYDGLITFASMLNKVKLAGYKLYLFVDNYDHFAYQCMMTVPHNRHLSREDFWAGESLFNTVFRNIKSFGSGDGVDRVFMTGVLSTALSRAANVFDDIHGLQEINDLGGFWEHEVADMLTQVLVESVHTQSLSEEERMANYHEALEMMRTYYGGSWFTTEASPPQQRDTSSSVRLYHPTSVFYFLQYLQNTGDYPIQMLDNGYQVNSKKLKYIASYDLGRKVLSDALSSENNVCMYEIETEFGADELLHDDMRYNQLASLLCYLGVLTINIGRDDVGQIVLKIPNLATQEIYTELNTVTIRT